MSSPLLRYTIDISDLSAINIQIEVHERMISWYLGYLEREGEYDYVHERIEYLNNILGEYLVAREFAKEGVRTYGCEKDEEQSYKSPTPEPKETK